MLQYFYTSKVLFTVLRLFRLLWNKFRSLRKRSTPLNLDLVLGVAHCAQVNIRGIQVHMGSAMIRALGPLLDKVRRSIPFRFALLVVETMSANGCVFSTVARAWIVVLLLLRYQIVFQIGHIDCTKPSTHTNHATSAFYFCNTKYLEVPLKISPITRISNRINGCVYQPPVKPSTEHVHFKFPLKNASRVGQFLHSTGLSSCVRTRYNRG